MEAISLGTPVLVKTITGESRPVRAVGIGPGVVYVTSEHEYQAACTEGREPTPFIGFPQEDVQKV